MPRYSQNVETWELLFTMVSSALPNVTFNNSFLNYEWIKSAVCKLLSSLLAL